MVTLSLFETSAIRKVTNFLLIVHAAMLVNAGMALSAKAEDHWEPVKNICDRPDTELIQILNGLGESSIMAEILTRCGYQDLSAGRDQLFEAMRAYTQCVNPTMTAQRQREFMEASLPGVVAFILNDPGKLYQYIPNMVGRLQKLERVGIADFTPLTGDESYQAWQVLQSEGISPEDFLEDIKKLYETF